MKKIIFILLLSPLFLFSQIKPYNIVKQTVSELVAEKGVHNMLYTLMGLNSMSDRNGGIYLYDSTSLATPDGFGVLKPTSVLLTSKGRFIKQVNNNTDIIDVTITGILNQNDYVVSFGKTFPIPPRLFAQLTSNTISTAISIPRATITTTGCTLHFTAIPTGAITVQLLAIKY